MGTYRIIIVDADQLDDISGNIFTCVDITRKIWWRLVDKKWSLQPIYRILWIDGVLRRKICHAWICANRGKKSRWHQTHFNASTVTFQWFAGSSDFSRSLDGRQYPLADQTVYAIPDLDNTDTCGEADVSRHSQDFVIKIIDSAGLKRQGYSSRNH